MKKNKEQIEIKDSQSVTDNIQNVDNSEKCENNLAEVNNKKEDPIVVKPQVAPIVYDNDYFKALDDARIAFRKFYKITDILKWVVTAVVLAMIILSFVLFANLQNGMTYMLVGTAIALLVLVAYTFIVGTVKKKKLQVYFASYYENTTKYVFDNKSYSDVKNEPEGKIQNTDFISSHLYINVAAVPSRNLTTFKYNNIPFVLADCAAQVKDKKKLVPVFVGKMIVVENNYECDDGIYIYYTCKKELALPPTGLTGINVVFEDDQMIIYSNNKDWKKVIKKTVKDALKNIHMDNVLIDMSISIQKGKTYFTMGYDDALMVIAFDKQFNPKPTETFSKQLLLVCEAVSVLNGKGSVEQDEQNDK